MDWQETSVFCGKKLDQAGAEPSQPQSHLGEVWSLNLKLKFEVNVEVENEVWSWGLNLKFEPDV